MSKRFSDTDKLDQIWLKRLSPEYKLVWMYLELACDHAGIWKIDVPDLLDKTGLNQINIKEFINECNKDYDKFTGEPITRERIKIVNDNKLWLTGFIQFQYSKKDGSLPTNSVVVSALNVLKAHSLLIEADSKGFLRVPKGYKDFKHPSIRVKDRDKDKDKDMSNNKKGEKKSDLSIDEVFADEDSVVHSPRMSIVKEGESGPIVNGVLLPEPLRDVDQIAEAYSYYVEYMKENFSKHPTSTTTQMDLQKLMELQEEGNDPVEVIKQTIQARNKSFYALRDYDNSKKRKTFTEFLNEQEIV